MRDFGTPTVVGLGFPGVDNLKTLSLQAGNRSRPDLTLKSIRAGVYRVWSGNVNINWRARQNFRWSFVNRRVLECLVGRRMRLVVNKL